MQDEFGVLDQFFTRRILKEAYTEKRAQFLAELMQITRKGNLCWRPSYAVDLPSTVVGFDDQPIVCDQGKYYLKKNWEIESLVIHHIQRLSQINSENKGSITLPEVLLPSQKKAIGTALGSFFSIISGGPGTGKTFTATHLVRAFCSQRGNNVKVILAAPTGKAASHLRSILGSIEGEVIASTLHRVLKIRTGENPLFSHRILDADLVIVDEASMLDALLLAKLLISIGDRTKLILMGDPDQLPPVEGGGLFSEMAQIFGSRLEQSMRVENKHLLQLAYQMNQGEFSLNQYILDWAFDRDLVKKLMRRINPSIKNVMPDPLEELKRLEEFRVLGALRQGPFGIDSLNRQIVQEMGLQIQPGQWWAIPIMVTENDPNLDLYNGSCGILIGKSEKGIDFQNSTAYFPEKIPFSSLPAFEIAFCLSIHKSQGSEFQKVLAIFAEGSENFGKEALYTAVTRAKKEVEIIGEERVLRAMLAQRSQKESGFTERMLALRERSSEI